MKRNINPALVLSVASLSVLSGCDGVENSSDYQNDKKNVLFIMVDDMTIDLGCYGNDVVKTPHIDKLASEGVRFTRAYCQFSLSNPSRASLLTGLRPDSTGIKGLGGHFRDNLPDVTTLPQLFRENGYFTASIGKVFHMGVPDAIARFRGDQEDSISWDLDIKCPGYELNSNGEFYNATPWEEDTAGIGGAISWLKAVKGDEQQHDHVVATHTINLLKKHKDEPFFIAPGFIRPHVPLVAPVRFFDMYDLDSIRLPKSIVNDRGDIPDCILEFFGANFNVTKEEHRRALRAYYACISFVDEQVGRIMSVMDSLGLRDETVVVFLSDHGFQLGEHSLWFKKFLYKESNRVPLIVSAPDFIKTKGEQCNKLVEYVDIYSTVAQLCGLEIKERKEGTSFVPLLNNPGMKWKNAVFMQTERGELDGRAVRTHKWWYNEYNNGKKGAELFNMNNDPSQFENLVHDDQYKDTVKMLKKILYEGWEAAIPHEK